MRYLITQTLLSKWSYVFDCFEGCESDAYDEFISYLKKEPQSENAFKQNGIDFENAVYARVHGLPIAEVNPDWKNGIESVATRLNGAQTQVKASRPLTVAGMDFLVYGILDALRAGHLFDVKFSNKSFHSAELPGKYLESAQHPAYFYIVPEATDFTYLVSDGKDLYEETYTRANTRHISAIIAEFITSITSMGLLDTYKQYWQA